VPKLFSSLCNKRAMWRIKKTLVGRENASNLKFRITKSVKLMYCGCHIYLVCVQLNRWPKSAVLKTKLFKSKSWVWNFTTEAKLLTQMQNNTYTVRNLRLGDRFISIFLFRVAPIWRDGCENDFFAVFIKKNINLRLPTMEVSLKVCEFFRVNIYVSETLIHGRKVSFISISFCVVKLRYTPTHKFLFFKIVTFA
jgi:hypothetical protein